MLRRTVFVMSLVGMVLYTVSSPAAVPAGVGALTVSPDGRYLQRADGAPFFWLGDTGWLLLSRPDRDGVLQYLDNRHAKGFNVVQVMVLHTADMRAPNGSPALVGGDPAFPHVTPGQDPANATAYDFWDHVDWVLEQAAQRGMYLAMVPAWGSLVKTGALHAANVEAYATFLARRFRQSPNVIWLVGGDIPGDDHRDVWMAMGRTLRREDPNHLITFHPFGRMQSSTWFHHEPWLDFNMFQSGHQDYTQDTSSPKRYGEDNWRYVLDDVALTPAKPVLDGEPSYENIPHGLHDVTQPYWTAADARRYAYWSVFAGACGHTYGNNAVMQFYSASVPKASYGPRNTWREAIDDPGAGQMRHLAALMSSRPFAGRHHAADVVVSGSGSGHDRVVATRGDGYVLVYTYRGRPFVVRLGTFPASTVRASWFDPRTGRSRLIGTFPNSGTRRFVPPVTPGDGHDWVLVMDAAARGGQPGR